MRPARVLGWAVAALICVGSPSFAQSQDSSQIRSPILVVESDRLYLDSAYGRRIAAEVSQDSAELSNENRRIEAELEGEEKALTEARPSLSPEEFRKLADAFDQKVRSIRREQETKARAIAQRQDSARAAFLTTAAPVLEQIMRETGAVVVLERRNVFLSLNAIDITQDALERIDVELGDGATLDGATSEQPD